MTEKWIAEFEKEFSTLKYSNYGDAVKVFITRKQQELVESILGEIPETTNSLVATIELQQLKQLIRDKYEK